MSAARGTAISRSDVDVYVVLRDGAGRDLRPSRSAAVDEIPITLAALERVDPFGTDGWWRRWSFAWARVLRDEAGGRVTDAVRRQATFTRQEQDEVLGARLDGTLNLWYRALKADRDGRPLERRLDPAQSVPWWLDCVSALEGRGRVRPYNRYPAWEVRTHPLRTHPPRTPDWSAARMVPQPQRVVDGDAGAVRKAFRSLEDACRRRDAGQGVTALGAIIDGWGDELALLRGAAGG